MAAFCENCGLDLGRAQDSCDCGTIDRREGRENLNALKVTSRIAGLILFVSAIVLGGQSIFTSLGLVPRQSAVPTRSQNLPSSPAAQILPKGFVGQWYLIYPSGHHPVAEDGTPIKFEYAEILSDGNIKMHTVFPDQDFSRTGSYSNIGRSKFHFTYANWNDDFGLQINGNRMMWRPPHGEAWSFLRCAKSDCTDRIR
jgi:hypothetical protein